jgi:hypothetical protein
LTRAILFQIPSIISTIIKEHRWLKRKIREEQISSVISDNCYGLWNRKVHSIIITHQLRIKCPKSLKFFEPLLHFLTRIIINKYDECHIPDLHGDYNYSGELSHFLNLPKNAKYIGLLSRFNAKNKLKKYTSYDVVVLISGPEPQRTLFENKCYSILKKMNLTSCIIRGLPQEKNLPEQTNNITWFNHVNDDEMACTLINAKRIVCRSGYSTIMDLEELKLNALLIPTPGQTEQEYLAFYNTDKSQFSMKNEKDLSEVEFFCKEKMVKQTFAETSELV